jgi:hypothetical protein
MRKVVPGIVCLIVMAGMVAAEEIPLLPTLDEANEGWVEVDSMSLPPAPDDEIAKRQFEGLYAWLMAEQVVEGVERPLTVHLTAHELAELELGVCEGCIGEPNRLRVGITKKVNVGGATDSGEWGAVRSTADGGSVWSAAVRSEGAFGLRLHFREFRLPSNTELYLFNAEGKVLGPYVGDGPLGTAEFWSHMITGDTVYLQLRRYGPADTREQVRHSMTLAGVGHVGWRLGSTMAAAKSFCDYNAPCIVNVSCTDAPPAVEDARGAVAYMQFVDEAFIYACSGGLINNTAEDGVPYFLTANHCLNTDMVAATLETYFTWSSPCGAVCPDQWADPVGVPGILGASVVQTNRVGDYTLLRLNAETAPPGTTLLGWTSEPVAFTDGASLFRISHPAAAPQAFSEHRVTTESLACLFWPRGNWIYSRDVIGAIEGGSSGSPVVNGDGRVVGQLSGSCGLFAVFPCARIWRATADGALAGYYDEVEPWLDPASACADDLDGDGFIAADCGGLDCDDGDFFVNPDAEEVCDNGIDDDCDLAVDDEDSDCAICLPRGAACTRSTQCCSGWCRWFGRTCR